MPSPDRTPAPQRRPPWDLETRLIHVMPTVVRRARLLEALLQVEEELESYDLQVPC